MEKSNKQSAKDREDTHKYGKIHRQAVSSLEQLRKDITASGHEATLKIYLDNKDVELSNHKIMTKMSHIMKVNSIYSNEMDHWREMLQLSFQLLNQFYLLLRSFDRVDRNMEESTKKLLKLCCGRQKIVKFLEETAAADKLNLSFELDDIMPPPPPAMSAKKRPLSNDEAPGVSAKIAKVAPTTFAKPKAVKSINFNVPKATFKLPAIPNLNETHVIDAPPPQLNSTFDLGEQPKQNALTTVSVKDQAVMQKIVKATKPNFLSKAAITLSKENKRSKTPKKFSPKKLSKGKCGRKLG